MAIVERRSSVQDTRLDVKKTWCTRGCRDSGGPAESWISRAAIHGWDALHAEQVVSYDTLGAFTQTLRPYLC
eukprot:4164394-Prymnesium_polylepis.1